MDIEDLQHYSDAWNAHDIDKMMSYMLEDCILKPVGLKGGTRTEGFDAVKARFIEVWTELSDLEFLDERHFVQGDRGCSEWTLVATRADVSKLEVDGCDLFTFGRGKIQVKNSLLKNRQ
jgi:ketosteroid isomerase-like protein